jgi:hypothetical protein
MAPFEKQAKNWLKTVFQNAVAKSIVRISGESRFLELVFKNSIKKSLIPQLI